MQHRARSGRAGDAFPVPLMTTALHNRCWNHEGREAVCRCPECGRSYCRECVTEHEARLLCASCLKAVSRAAGMRTGRLHRFVPAAMVLGGLVFAWCFFFAAGETMTWIASR